MSLNGMGRGIYEKITAKTASYQVKPEDLGTLFTTRGASGAVTFTLPEIAGLLTGWWCEFFGVADQNMIVAAATADADKMVVFNDAAADSIAYQTAGELIGAGFRMVYDGTGWLCFPLANEAATVTIVTA